MGRLSSVAAAVCLLLSVSVSAQDAPWMMKLSIHGYLSQAYADSDEYPIFGIPTDGTTDYRDLALQFRYDQDKKDVFLVQLRHERIGESPRAAAFDDIALDWAFYQRNFGDRLSVKAGRIPLPLGIFNEAGGGAITSPFYRAPIEFYERQYTSKTVDGILGSMSFGAPAGWSFDVDGYAGQWVLERGRKGDTADAKNAFGAQFWANTPLQGVRAGFGAYRCTVKPDVGVPSDYLMLHGSVEADLDRWMLATEYFDGDLDGARYRSYYAQVGFQLTRHLSLHAREAIARLDLSRGRHPTLSDDFGLSINYMIHPQLRLKLEGHTNDGFLREDIDPNFTDPPSQTHYVIASFVASF